MRIILILLLLTGCMNSYQPSLAVPATSPEKYESDRQSCIEEAKQRMRKSMNDNMGTTALIGAIPVIGIVVQTTRNDDYTKSGFTMTDECMSKKGYKLAN